MTGSPQTEQPKRIQRRRRRPPPEGVVFVGWPSKWASPFATNGYNPYRPDETPRDKRERANRLFRDMVSRAPMVDGEPYSEEIRRQLAGRDLACWCPTDLPCHADVLLEIANGGTDDRG